MCSAAERRADEASYDVTAWLKCMYMKDFIGRGFSGKVTGVTPNGVYVTLMISLLKASSGQGSRTSAGTTSITATTASLKAVHQAK